MKTNFRERLTMYRCFIRPKVHCSPEFSFNTVTFAVMLIYLGYTSIGLALS